MEGYGIFCRGGVVGYFFSFFYLTLSLPVDDERQMFADSKIKNSAGIIGFLKIAAHFTAGQMSNTVLSLWGNAQMLLSILCCCVPIYNSLFSKRKSEDSHSYAYSPIFRTGNSDKGRKGPLLSDKTVGSISVSREYGSVRDSGRYLHRPGHAHGQYYDGKFGPRSGSEKMHPHRPHNYHHHQHSPSHTRNPSTESTSSRILAPKTSNLSTATGMSPTLTVTTTTNSQTPLFAHQYHTDRSTEEGQRQVQVQTPPVQSDVYGSGHRMEWARLYDQCSSSMSTDLGLVPQTVTTVTAGDAPVAPPPPPPPRTYRPSQGYRHMSARPPTVVHLVEPEPRASPITNRVWPFTTSSSGSRD